MKKIGDILRRVSGKMRKSPPTYEVHHPIQLERPEHDSRPMVLVVDDARVFDDTFAIILNQSGYYPLMAYSGEQALALIEQVRPDLVFADIVMGWVNGVGVAMAVKQRWPDCPVLLTTGHYENLKFLEPAEAAGYYFEVLWRPMAPNDLLAKVAAALAGAAS